MVLIKKYSKMLLEIVNFRIMRFFFLHGSNRLFNFRIHAVQRTVKMGLDAASVSTIRRINNLVDVVILQEGK